MKKILQIGMTNNKGGIESYLINQYRNLDGKIRYDFINITGEYEIAYSKEIINKGGKIYSVVSRHKNPIKHYYSLLMLLYNLRKEYGVIVLNTCNLDYVYPLFIAKIIGIPKRIIHSHNSGNESQNGLSRRLLRKINKIILRYSANTFWACSRMAGKWMFGRHDYSLIHNAIEIDKYTFDLNVRTKQREKYDVNDKFVVGNVARFSPQKNHVFLIKVFSELLRFNPNSILWLVGAFEYDSDIFETVKREIRKRDIEDKVVFLGERSDVCDLYQAMDCLVMPSLFEGLSMTAIEAQATGMSCYFSDKMSRETAITSNCHFISLNKDAYEWAREIYYGMNKKRTTLDDEIRCAGYDIKKEIKRVEEMYLEG